MAEGGPDWLSEIRLAKDRAAIVLVFDDQRRLELAVDESPTAAENLERTSLIEVLNQLIQEKLTEKQRIAITALLKNMPVEEIARKTNSNRNAVYKLVHDARMRLKDGFEQAGITAEDFQGALP